MGMTQHKINVSTYSYLKNRKPKELYLLCHQAHAVNNMHNLLCV
jgi:hypothetical protein